MAHRFNVFDKDNDILATIEIGEWRVTSIKFVKTTISAGIRCHAILKKGSKITSTYYSANDPVKTQRNLILENKDEQVDSREIKPKYHTLQKDFRFSEEMSLSGIYGVITGDEGGSPYHFKFSGDGNLNGEDANRFFAIQHINKISAANFSSLSELEQFRSEYEAEYSDGKPSDEYIIKRYQRNIPNLFELSKSSTPPLVRELRSVLEWKKNVILEGVPGVGKSFCINGLKEELGIDDNSPRFKSVTFSPSTGQEEFIGGLFPIPGESPPIFKFEPGPLLELAEAASQSSKEHVLFIDEINRGNIPKIMGQIMTVIEGSKRFDSKRSIRHLTENMEDNVLRAALFTNGDKVEYLGLPDNLWIIGAMNTSDRSVVQIDSALRRRFAFIRVPTMLTSAGIGQLKHLLLEEKEDFWTKENLKQADEFLKMLIGLNEKLDSTIGPDAVLGHSYLFEVKCCEDGQTTKQIGKEKDIQPSNPPRKAVDVGAGFNPKSAFYQSASVVNRMINSFVSDPNLTINKMNVKQRRIEFTAMVAQELSVDVRTVNNKLYRSGLGYDSVDRFDEAFLDYISNRSGTAELYLRMKNKFKKKTHLTKIDEIFGINLIRNEESSTPVLRTLSANDDCLWPALRDMYLYSILPQIADTLNANGTQNANLIESATRRHIEYLNERLESNKITGGLKFSSATSGEWRVE